MDYRLKMREARLREICGRYVYPWLRAVGEKFKAFGAYPLCLSDYYSDPMDKQVAEVVSLVVSPRNRDRHIMHLHSLLGGSPWEKVRSRDFMELSAGDTLFGVSTEKRHMLFNLLDWIWEVSCEDRVPLEYVILGEMGLIKRHHRRPLSSVIDYADMTLRMENVLVKMSLPDGYGAGLWHFVSHEDLPCPLDASTRRVLKIFYPLPKGVNGDTLPHVLSFMGFERKVDFIYSAWGYLYLRRHEDEAVRAFEKKLGRWYGSLNVRYDLYADIPTTCIE